MTAPFYNVLPAFPEAHRANVQDVGRPTARPSGMVSPLAQLKVMTFNLRRHKASDGQNAWLHRRDAAAEIIHRHAPDVVGTQEGLPDQVGFLEERFPEYGFVGEARFGGRNDEFNAILYRKDRLKLLANGDFWLSGTPDAAGSRSWGNLVPRMATWARFMEKDTGNVFHHLNTHLDHLVPRARANGARLIAKRLPQDVPVIMTGDFNAIQRGGTYRYLTREAGLADSRWACSTRVPRWNPTFHRFTGRGLYRIDYVLGRGIARYSNYQVVRDRIDGRLPSDHFPVVTQVHVPQTTRTLDVQTPAALASA